MAGNDDKQEENVNKETINAVGNNEPEMKEDIKNDIRDGEWMIRPCKVYMSEFKDCKSLRARFYQYFIDGENHYCGQWNIDYKNCMKWRDNNDDTAYNDLVGSERKRRIARLTGNAENNVWTRRKEPPKDWNEPLPAWLIKRNEGTFLAAKQHDIDTKGFDDEKDLYIPSCAII